jgi:hypothetical protein
MQVPYRGGGSVLESKARDHGGSGGDQEYERPEHLSEAIQYGSLDRNLWVG